METATHQWRARGPDHAAILEAAIARFGRDGFRATSVADIARDAAVGGTVAYAYFPNKEALFLGGPGRGCRGCHPRGRRPRDRARFPGWRDSLILTLLSAVERHPLARRVLAGLEEVTDRVIDIPALPNSARRSPSGSGPSS